MKKKISLFILLLLFLISSINFPAPISFRPIQVRQPNGKLLNIFQSGDEYYNWMHDKDDFTIIFDHSTGYYVYAIVEDNMLVPSHYIVGESDPASAGLPRSANVFPPVRVRENAQRKLSKKSSSESATGTYYQLMVFVRLKDGEYTKDAAFYDDIYNTGAGSIGQYFKETSYGQLTVDSKIYSRNGKILLYYDDPHSTNYYKPYDAQLNPEGYQLADRWIRESALFDSAMNYIKRFIPADAQLDGNNDGIIDNINILLATDNGPWQGIIWPHMSSNNSITINGAKSGVYNIVLKDAFEERGGVICESIHEMLHSFGLPDLYRCTGNYQRPVGAYEIMANGFGHMLMYCKYKLGWINDIPVISKSGRYTLKSNMFEDGSVYRINSPRSSKEYYIVEFRIKEGAFEWQIPGTGMIIYRINENVDFINDWGNLYGPPDHIYIYRPDGNLLNNGSMSKAGFTDLEGRTMINDHTNPCGFLSDGLAGGLDISNVKIENGTVSFDVNIKDTAEVTLNKDYVTGTKNYSWIDISKTGTEITNWINGPDKGDTAKDDGYSAKAIPLGLNFYFYGQVFDSIYAGINGLASFTNQHLSANSRTYAFEFKDAGTYLQSICWPGNSKFPNSIAMAYNDFTIQGTDNGKILYQTIGRKFILSYENVGVKGGIPGQGCSFQLVLDASDSTVTINYKKFDSNETALSSKIGIAANALKAIGYYDPVLFKNNIVGDGTSVYFKPDPLFITANYKVQTVDYDWTDISATGKEITRWQNGQWVFDQALAYQFSADKIPLGFNFSFYGQKYDSIYVGMDGVISFTHHYLNHTYPDMDIDGSDVGGIQYGLFNFPNSIGIAYNGFSLFRGDTYGGGKIIYQTIGKKFILTYLYVGSIAQMAHDTLNVFQIVLNGDDNTIQLNYQMIGTYATRNMMTVGLRKDDFSDMIYVNQGLPSTNVISDRTSLLFTPGDFHPVGALITGNLTFNKNWNLTGFSSKLQTDSVKTLFSSVGSDVDVILGYNNGALVYKPDVEDGFNNLMKLSPLSGYWIKMKNARAFSYEGIVINPQTPIVLNKGWNLINYLPLTDDSVAHALSSVFNNLIAVQGFDNGGLTYSTTLPNTINTLAVMSPDHGYWIKLKNADTLIYPTSTAVLASNKTYKSRLKNYSVASSGVTPTTEWINIYALNINFNGQPLPVGTRITAKDPDGVICGETEVKKAGEIGLMPVYKDDFTTKDIDEGALYGDMITIYFNDFELPQKIKWEENGEIVNLNNLVTDLSGNLNKNLPQVFALGQNYPNPFNPSTNIKYQLPKLSKVSLTVYNILGQRVKTLIDEIKTAGYYEAKWNGDSDNGTVVSSGLYLIRMEAGNYSNTKKMLLIK